MKEAYIKAIGAGLGFELKRLEFRHADWTGISIWVDGQKLANWKFWFYELGKGHLVILSSSSFSSGLFLLIIIPSFINPDPNIIRSIVFKEVIGLFI